MNPGELRERVALYTGNYTGSETWNLTKTIWAKKVAKNKRRDNEQNEEFYKFIVRKTDIVPYMKLQHKGRWYDILTVEPLRNGYLEISCELSKVHSYYDTCTVERLTWSENTDGEMVKADDPTIYANIPCQLVILKTGATDQTELTNSISQTYRLDLETKYDLKVGDKITIKHQINEIVAAVESFFRYQTHQEVILELEGDA